MQSPLKVLLCEPSTHPSIQSLYRLNTMEDLQLQERIADLERELCSAKLQLVCAKSSLDSLEHQLAMTTLALFKAARSNATASHSESSRANGAESDRSSLHRLNYATIEVPTRNPLSRKKSGDDLVIYRKRKTPCTKKVLNPGSCASALNLYAEVDALLHPSSEVDSRGGGELSLRRPTYINRVDRLNMNSCASGLNLLELLGLPSLPTPSMLSSASSTSKRASHDIGLLFGNHGPSSASSTKGRCRVGSRNNPTRLGNNRYTDQVSSKRNAEWDVLK